MPRHSDSNKAQLWRQHFADFDRSQLTVAQFCQSIGCSAPTFYHWKRKLNETHAQTTFLRVQAAEQQPAFIEVKLPSGVSLRVPLSAIASLSEILEQVV